jgi:hypothetical protein
MSEILTQEEIIKNENNRTSSPIGAHAYAIKYASLYLQSIGVDVVSHDLLTRNHPAGHLALSVKANDIIIGLRANVAYLHNEAGMVGVTGSDDVDALIVVTPASPSSPVTDKRYLFIPNYRFAGKKTLYINRVDKAIWRGPEALLSIAMQSARKYAEEQTLLLRKLAGKKITKKSANILVRETERSVDSGVQEFIDFELFPEIV